MLVQEITFKQAKRTIRELVMDLGLVDCFKAVGKDLNFFKDDTKIILGDEEHLIVDGEFDRLYDLVGLLVDKGLSIEFLIDYVPADGIQNLRDSDDELSVNEPYTFKGKNYFSDEVIEALMVDFFEQNMVYDGKPRTVEEIFNQLCYMEKRRLIFWVSYWLIDRKRMLYASAKNLISTANGDCGVDLVNKVVTTTTRIGEVFTENETVEADGSGADGFTALWGDKYGYLTKLQLYIRTKYENLFGDYSLRDDSARVSSFSISKVWQNDAWIDTLGYSSDTYNILVGDRSNDKAY